MLFDVQAALAEILAHDVATPATSATLPPKSALMSQVSRVSLSQPAEIAAPKVLPFTPSTNASPSRSERDYHPYGFGPNGNPRTWEGRIVSLAVWRGLSEWDKHGSTGQMWNGLTRQWEPDGGAA